MKVSETGGKSFYEKLYQQKKREMEQALNSTDFSKNLREKGGYASAVHQDTYSNLLQTSMIFQNNGRVSFSAVLECGTKHLSYAEADHIKICMEEGYTFKAQVSVTDHTVYIEKKCEDGTVRGYEVHPLELDPDTTDPVEQMALESWEVAQRGMAGENPGFRELSPSDEYADLTIEEAMRKFYAFVEDRIQNGAPKYRIGASEMSVKEWNTLLEKVDENLDEAKTALREEIEQAHKKQIEKDRSEEEISKEQIARLLNETI